jgi:hypothetical protein
MGVTILDYWKRNHVHTQKNLDLEEHRIGRIGPFTLTRLQYFLVNFMFNTSQIPYNSLYSLPMFFKWIVQIPPHKSHYIYLVLCTPYHR